MKYLEKRSAQHSEKIDALFKYVLNDHFVIVCLFFFGALGMLIQKYLKV